MRDDAMDGVLPSADSVSDRPLDDVAADNAPVYDSIVYPVKRTPGRPFIYDFLNQNLKSAYYRRLLHEGK
jgi:hypothetical protein